MADENTPKSSFDEDSTFSDRHVKKSKTDVGNLAKMESEGKATLSEKDTNERKVKIRTKGGNKKTRKYRGHTASVVFVMLVLVVGAAFSVILSPSLLLVNIKENLINDLNDGTKAYHVYSNKVLDMATSGGGCDYQSKPTIMCKFKTMSYFMRHDFSSHHFDMTPPFPPDPRDITKLTGVPTVPFKSNDPPKRLGTRILKGPHGKSVSGKISEAAENDPTFRAQLYKVFNPRTSMFQDRKFDERLYNMFGITRTKFSSGPDKNDVYKDFDDRVRGDGSDYIDINGYGNYGADKLSKSSSRWTKIMNNMIKDKHGFKTTSFATLACAYDAYERTLENSVVRARRVSVARYAMNYLAIADGIKAGMYSDSLVPMTLADVLSDDRNGATDVSSYRTPAMFEGVGSPIGVADSSMSLMLLTAPGSMMSNLKGLLSRFSQGIGLSSPAVPPGDGIQGAKSDGPYGWCTAGQNNPEKDNNEKKRVVTMGLFGPMITWYCNVHAQSLTGILGYGLQAAEMSLAEPIYYISPEAAVACETIETIPVQTVSSIITPMVQTLANITLPLAVNKIKSDIPYLEDNPSSKDVMDTIFSGTGIILGDMAQSRGLKPVTASDVGKFKQYLKETAAVRQQYRQNKMLIARSEPFNIYNRYSFLGIISQKLFNNMGVASSAIDGVGNILGIFGSSLDSVSSIINPTSSALFSQPVEQPYDMSRLNCPFNNNPRFWGKDGIKIKADFGCNIRYYMPKQVLNMDLQNVIKYMTDPSNSQNSKLAKKEVDQLNSRSASGLDSSRLSKLKSKAQEGISHSFIDKKTGKPNPHTQYSKFLQYCVNRQNPWGGYALNMDWEPRDYGHDENYRYGRDVYTSLPKPDDDDAPESYFANGAGPPVDQDWYTGKNCLDDSDMINNFRAYTLACSILASMSGTRECWDADEDSQSLPDDFYLSNDILFLPYQYTQTI